MSNAQIEQFYNRAKNDPAMFNKLMADTQTPDEFIDKAMALGAESGFSFTREEADTWISGQIKAKANGELSDLQLEGVAGGKDDIINNVFGPIARAEATAAGQVGRWLASW